MAAAPDPDGAVIFLQPTRAVNVVKGCQAWVLAEEDEGDELDEEAESVMLPIFMHLAPILQNVPGSHWPFIFDVLENVLERVSLTEELEQDEDSSSDSTALVALGRALRLLQVLEELAKRNKALMEEWKGRRMAVLTVVRDSKILGHGALFYIGILTVDFNIDNATDAETVTSAPRSACRELVLSIVQHLPSSLIDETTLPKVCRSI